MDQPAIVRQAVNLDTLAWEIKADIESAYQQAKKGLSKLREAGEKLHSAKIQIPFGEWLDWLEKHKIPSQRSSEAIRVYENWDKFPNSGNLTEALKVLLKEQRDSNRAEGGDEEEETKLTKSVIRLSEGLQKVVDKIVRSRKLNKADADRARDFLQSGTGLLRRLSDADPRPPEFAPCRDCQEPCVWVTTTNDKRVLLDREPSLGGRFEIIAGVAVTVAWDGTNDQKGHKVHFLTCSKRKAGI